MRPLVVLLTAADPVRAHAGIGLIAAQAALGGRSQLHLDAGAIPLLADPALTAAIAAACDLGATLSLCPTGLADHPLVPPPFPGADRCGLVALLGELADDARLVAI
jgi:hypothetical protein